jgi:hypothetical protein
MKKQFLLSIAFLVVSYSGLTQVVTTASSVTICTGPTTVQIPVKVSSFTAVGTFSLKFSYVNSEITSPTVVYKDPGVEAWGTFLVNTSTPGIITVSAFDPDVTPPIPGLTLANNTILFTLQFNIGTITTPAALSFIENLQGTWCEYGGVGPTYTPFVDTPMGTYYINGSVTIVPDPVAPGLTKNPAAATVCAGTTLTVTTSAGSGGTGTIADEYSYSTNNGSNWSAWSVSVPSFAAITGTNLIRSRRTATGTGCDESSYNSVSWTVVADPVAPAITKSPADAIVCAGTTLTVTTSAGSGGTGTIADEYSYSTNNGSSWSAWSATVPSFASVTGTNLVRSRRTATGIGCDESPYNSVSWSVVADPVAPGLTKSPVDATVCAGTTLTVSNTAGSGGTGTIADEYSYSTNNGSNWSAWSATVPSFAAVTGTNLIRSRRTATGTGCDESTYNSVSWTVAADPVAPGLTKSPVDAAVCSGTTLTVTTSAGSGGTGTITDEYSYSTNNGTNWSAWSVSVPSFAAVTGTNLIRSRRTATGTGCDESTYNSVSWTVAADPVAPAITKNPVDATVCSGGILTVTTSAGSGGTGTIADEYSYSTNNGSSWSSWSATVPSFAAITGTNLIRSRRTATGTGCDESSYNSVSWTVVPVPVAPVITKSPNVASVCSGDVLTITTSPGSGGTGTTTDEYSYSTNNGSSWSSWSTSVPSFASVAGTNLVRSRRTATGFACTESSYNSVSWIVNAKQKISGTFNYHNISSDILLTGADITVSLYKSIDESHSTLIGSDVTDASGYYEFPAICPDCDYDIVATSTHAIDGAVNTTDAAQANYWGPNPYSIEKVRFHAGDVVGPDNFIGATDAGRIQLFFVNGTPFDCDDWTFWRSGTAILHNPLIAEPEYTEYYPKVTLAVGSDFDADMYGLVSGDFNRSFNPTLTKAASSTLSLVYSGNRQIGAGQEFDLPVKMVNGSMVGAVSLILDYPGEMAEIEDVIMSGSGGSLKWAAKDGELRISWHSPSPMNLASSDDMLTIRMKTTTGFTSGNSIRLNLASDPLNELADETFNVIGDAIISVETIESNALGIIENNAAGDVGFSCRPNPARDYTLFVYSLPFEGQVTLEITNLLGYKLVMPVNEIQDAGDHYFKFDTYTLPNGVYTATLRVKSKENEAVRTIKLIKNN